MAREEEQDERVIPTGPTENEPLLTGAKKTRTPLPTFQLVIVALIQLSEPITGIVIYPFIIQFINETGITNGDEKKTGYYAGIIESVFFFAEAATVVQWGWLSDRIGRRPVLLLGPLGLTLAMLSFGYSTTFWALVLSRCMQGTFNGNIGVSKTVVAELADETNIGDAFAFTSPMWTIGLTIAPIIGGVLSNPATRWPHFFGKLEFFKDHPYFLPCLTSGTVAFISFVLAFFGLKETLKRSDVCHNGYRRIVTETDSESPHAALDTPSEIGDDHNSSDGDPQQDSQPPSMSTVLRSKTLRTVIISFLFLMFTDMYYIALMPLVYSTPIDLGGLGLDPYAIGVIRGIWGALNAIFQFTFLGPLIRKYGATGVFKASYPSLLVCAVTYPVSVYFASRNGQIGIGTCVTIVVQSICQFVVGLAYGAIYVIIAEVTPKPVLGTVNGFFQMVGCIARTIAPTFASSLFSISLENNIAGGNFVYVVLICIILIGIRCCLWLPEHTRPITH